MDNFKEEVVIRRNQGMFNFLYFLSWVALVVSGIMALMGLQATLSSLMSGSFQVYPLIVFLLFGAIVFLVWRGKDNLRTEYEYTFTNGELDVAKVLNNEKRKYLTNLDLKTVEAAGAVASASFQRYVTMPDVKKHNWFLNREAKLYYYYFTKKGAKHLIVLELSDEMAELTRKPNYMGYGIWQS